MPLLWIGLSYLVGILLAARIHLPSTGWALCLCLGITSALVEYFAIPRQRHALRSQKLFSTSFGLLLAACAVGGWRFNGALPRLTAQELAWYTPQNHAVVTGVVSSYPQRSAQTTIAVVSADSVRLNGKTHPISGRLEMRLPAGFDVRYGDRVRLSGKLDAVIKGNLPIYAYPLARQGIFCRMPYPHLKTLGWGYGNPLISALYWLRRRAQYLIYEQMPFPESALLEGILLGIEWNIPDYLNQAYRASGLMHIIAISGFNIVLISNLVSRIFRRIFPYKLAGALAAAAIASYTLLVGAEPAVVRAAIMGILAIPAHAIGRRMLGVHALAVAGVAMLLINPLLLWDASFQLSFLATLGLMVLADPLANRLKNELARVLPEHQVHLLLPPLTLLSATLAAQFAVSPVLLSMDTNLPVFSLAANLIVLPVQPLVMALGGLSVWLGLVSPWLGGLLGQLTWPLILLSNRSALYFSLHPYAALRLPDWSDAAASALVFFSLILFTTRQLRSLTAPAARAQP